MIVKVYCLASEKDKLPKNFEVPEDIKTSEAVAAPEGDKKTEEKTTEEKKIEEKTTEEKASEEKKTFLRKKNLKHEL